jgi:hypothetical protein
MNGLALREPRVMRKVFSPPQKAFSRKEPLNEQKRPLLAALGHATSAVRDRLRGLVKAVKAPEREVVGTPIPPEAVIASTGPLLFKVREI